MARSRSGPGISPWRMAKEDGIPYTRLRRAIDGQQVKVVEIWQRASSSHRPSGSASASCCWGSMHLCRVRMRSS